MGRSNADTQLRWGRSEEWIQQWLNRTVGYKNRERERENGSGAEREARSRQKFRGQEGVLGTGSSSVRDGSPRGEDCSGWGRPGQAGLALSLRLIPSPEL